MFYSPVSEAWGSRKFSGSSCFFHWQFLLQTWGHEMKTKTENVWSNFSGSNFEFNCREQGGLAARSETEFIWSPQLRNLAEWDWVPLFLQKKYGGECGRWKMMSFCSVLRFTASQYQEKVFMNFFHGIFGHQESWCMNSSWVTSLNVIRHLGKFSYL